MSAVGRFQSGNGKTPRLRRGDGGRNGPLREDATVTFAAERELAGIDDIIEQLNRQLVGLAPVFANARTVRNSLELARLRHAHRVSSDLHREWTRDDLMRLEPVDILEP